jgi:hypothetical protein
VRALMMTKTIYVDFQMTPEELLKQAPDGCTLEFAAVTLTRFNGDFNRALLHLWQVPTEPQKEKTDWEKRREICNELSAATYHVLQQNKMSS